MTVSKLCRFFIFGCEIHVKNIKKTLHYERMGARGSFHLSFCDREGQEGMEKKASHCAL